MYINGSRYNASTLRSTLFDSFARSATHSTGIFRGDNLRAYSPYTMTCSGQSMKKPVLYLSNRTGTNSPT